MLLCTVGLFSICGPNVSLKNKIIDTNQLKEYVELTFHKKESVS